MTPLVTFPAPAKRLNLNDRMHWATKAKLTKTWRQTTKHHCKQQTNTVDLPLPPSIVQIEFGVTDPNRRRDPHNWSPTVKAILDGMVDAGIWPDDNTQHVFLIDPIFTKNTTQTVTIHTQPFTTFNGILRTEQ